MAFVFFHHVSDCNKFFVALKTNHFEFDLLSLLTIVCRVTICVIPMSEMTIDFFRNISIQCKVLFLVTNYNNWKLTVDPSFYKKKLILTPWTMVLGECWLLTPYALKLCTCLKFLTSYFADLSLNRIGCPLSSFWSNWKSVQTQQGRIK